METQSGEPKKYPSIELVKLKKQVDAMDKAWSINTTLEDIQPLETQRNEAMRELMRAFSETRELTGYITLGEGDTEAGMFPAPVEVSYRDDLGDTSKERYIVLTLEGFKAIEFSQALMNNENGELVRSMYETRPVQRIAKTVFDEEGGIRRQFTPDQSTSSFLAGYFGIKTVKGIVRTGYFNKGNSNVKFPLLCTGSEFTEVYPGDANSALTRRVTMGILVDIDADAGYYIGEAINKSMQERAHSLNPKKIDTTTQLAQKLTGVFKPKPITPPSQKS